MKKFVIFLPVLLALSLLQGCHGGGSGATTQNTVRLINGTSGSLDMLQSTSTQTSTKLATAVTYGAASSSVTINSGISTIELENSGSNTPSFSTSFSFTTAVDYALLAYTSGQNLRVASFSENEVAPATGDGKIRIVDLSADAGSLDVYMALQDNTKNDTYTPGTVSAALSASTALVTGISGTTSYYELPKNTYHIWVTGANDRTDLRLNIPSIVINDQQILTLVMTSATGGVLLDGLLVTQPLNGVGPVVAEKNGYARIRIASNFPSTDSITAASGVSATSVGNSILSTSVSSTSPLSAYTLVPVLGTTNAAGTLVPVHTAAATAGNVSVTVLSSINSGTGTATTSYSGSVTAGADITLLATGSGSAPTYFPLSDDNTRPAGGYAKLRLVNGNNSSIQLSYDNVTYATGVALGTASIPVTLASGGNTNGITAGGITISPVSFQSQGVYSLFMLSNSASPYYVLYKDH